MFQAGDGRKLLGDACHALRDVRPVIIFALAQHYAIQRDAPGLFRGMREAQALEGNREPDDVAVGGQAAFVIPNGVKAEIVGLPFGVNGVGLDAERVGIKDISPVVIPKGVEVHAHAIVLIHIFAF